MTSLATGHSPVLDKAIKSLHPIISTKSSKSSSMATQTTVPVAETELCFFQTVTLQGRPFPHVFIPVSHNPLATCSSTLLGGYSLDSLKSHFINTLISQWSYVDLGPGVG